MNTGGGHDTVKAVSLWSAAAGAEASLTRTRACAVVAVTEGTVHVYYPLAAGTLGASTRHVKPLSGENSSIWMRASTRLRYSRKPACPW